MRQKLQLYQMEKDKKKSINSKKKKGANDQNDQENLLQQVLKILESLYEARLIERIARPIDKKVRQQQIDKYGIKLQLLHEKLAKIKNQIIDITYTDNANARNKSVFGEVTNKTNDWRKIIRNIQSKYIEILVDGSYKFFKKICVGLGLSYKRNMDLIGIEEWAANCLDTKPVDACC